MIFKRNILAGLPQKWLSVCKQHIIQMNKFLKSRWKYRTSSENALVGRIVLFCILVIWFWLILEGPFEKWRCLSFSLNFWGPPALSPWLSEHWSGGLDMLSEGTIIICLASCSMVYWCTGVLYLRLSMQVLEGLRKTLHYCKFYPRGLEAMALDRTCGLPCAMKSPLALKTKTDRKNHEQHHRITLITKINFQCPPLG